ncbi:MAG TPA: hypothetical protein VJK09_03250 [Candidatus Paceibacterota bacterium]
MKKPGELRLTMQLVLQGNITIGYGQVPVLDPIEVGRCSVDGHDKVLKATVSRELATRCRLLANFTRSGCAAVQIPIDVDENVSTEAGPLAIAELQVALGKFELPGEHFIIEGEIEHGAVLLIRRIVDPK